MRARGRKLPGDVSIATRVINATIVRARSFACFRRRERVFISFVLRFAGASLNTACCIVFESKRLPVDSSETDSRARGPRHVDSSKYLVIPLE